MYSAPDSIAKTYTYIQGLRSTGHTYAGTPVYNVSKSDLEALSAVGDKYGIPFEWLVNLINFESGRTFNPAITNNIGATGLIQFIPSTAADKSCLNTSTAALRQMTFKQQLAYVDKYLACNLKPHLTISGKIPSTFTQGDLFMTIFYPAAVGKPNYVFPANVQAANAGIARPRDYVEKALRVSLFPLSVFPYTLAEAKKKYGNAVTFAKNHWVPIMIIGIILVVMAIVLIIFNKRVTNYIAKA